MQPTRRVSAEVAKAFKDIPVANVSDVTNRICSAGASLRPMRTGLYLSGPAFTVKTRPGDNLVLHYAIDNAQPGDVIVVDAGGDLTNSLMGEMMLSYATMRGIAGFVINGAVRDFGFLSASDTPVYAAGVTHRGPYKTGPGEANVPVSIDGMVVHPGDLIIGDDDGVMCVPYDEVDEVMVAARKKAEGEAKQLKAIFTGEYGPAQRTWVKTSFDNSGFDFVEL